MTNTTAILFYWVKYQLQSDLEIVFVLLKKILTSWTKDHGVNFVHDIHVFFLLQRFEPQHSKNSTGVTNNINGVLFHLNVQDSYASVLDHCKGMQSKLM